MAKKRLGKTKLICVILFIHFHAFLVVLWLLIIIKHEMENEQLLIGIARFLYVSGWFLPSLDYFNVLFS